MSANRTFFRQERTLDHIDLVQSFSASVSRGLAREIDFMPRMPLCHEADLSHIACKTAPVLGLILISLDTNYSRTLQRFSSYFKFPQVV